MESFNLNIIPGKDRPVCHASQYDIGRTIHVNLFEGFNVFTLDGTEVISISVRKPDGNVVTESVTNTSDSYVEFVTTEQMTACHGSNLCELKLEKGADVIGTMNFILEVEQDPLDGGVQSDTQIHNLQTQVADLVAIEVADQYDSANVIFDAVPTAGHGVGYAVTSEGVKNEVDPIKADVSSLQSDVGTLQSDVGYIKGDISDAFDDTATYAVGDFVIYQNVLYKCMTAVTTPGAWDGTKWTQTSVADEIGQITAISTGTITPESGIDLAPSNAILESKNGVTNVSISLGTNGTASLARWGNVKICSLSTPPRNTQRSLSRVRLGQNDWFSVLVQIETNGDLYIYDTFGVTTGTITGFFFSDTYLS